MRVPQVSERVKEAPAQALRAMFAGIGQLLLLPTSPWQVRHDEAAAEAKAAAAKRPPRLDAGDAADAAGDRHAGDSDAGA